MKTIKTMKTMKLLALLVITSIAFTSCSKNHEDDDDHEEELITNVTYTLTNGNNVVTLEFEDLDGEGGKVGTYTASGPLTANTIYTGTIKLENKTETPAENITLEVQKEDDEHEFFYTSNISEITKTDVDGNNNPLGIKSTLTIGAAGAGTITVILKHEPKKPNNGTSIDAGGSTDVEVSFPVTVQ